MIIAQAAMRARVALGLAALSGAEGARAMLNAARVLPAGPGGRDVSIEKRRPTNAPAGRIAKLRDYYAYRNAIPMLFKGERFRGLKPIETAVLAALLRRARAEYEGRCWPMHEQLVADLHGGVSVRHLTRVIASLRDKGWLMIETTHAAQRLPNGRAVVGGERNVYRANPERVLGALPTAAQDGQDGAPRMDTPPFEIPQIPERIDVAATRDPDQDLDQHTDPQAPPMPESRPTSKMETARALLAYWARTSFPEAPEGVDFAAAPDGHKRVARVVGLLERGFTPEVLKGAILGAPLDTYVRAAGCPLGLVLGDKVLHYAELGNAARRRRERLQRLADGAPRARTVAAGAVPCAPPVSADKMRMDLERVFGGAA